MSDREQALRALGAAQLALLVPLVALDRRMVATGGPGIIPFELAGTPERSRRMMERWGESGRAAARRSLLLDYPYLAAYSAFNLLACRAAGDVLRRHGAAGLAEAAAVVAPLQLAAGAFDAAENTTLLAILGGRDGRLPALARGFARAKFALLGLGWGYEALGLAGRLVKRPRRLARLRSHAGRPSRLRATRGPVARALAR